MAKVLIGNFKGPKGDQGVKGDPGTAATIQVGTTQTVQPEENAEVTNTGTTSAAVLNFKIPRGKDGMTDLTAEYKDDSSYTCQPTVNAPVVVKDLDGKTEQGENPSPDNPQVIKGVGGMGYFDGEWVQGNISSTGTVGTETTGITSANAIPCKQNDSISVTYEDSIDVIAVAFYNASGAYISASTSGNSVDTFTATAPANAASFKVNLRVVSESTIAPNGAKYCTVTINGEYQTGVEVTGKNLLNIEEWLESKGAEYTKNGNEYIIRVVPNLSRQPLVLFNKPQQVTLSAENFENITSTNVRIELLDGTGIVGTLNESVKQISAIADSIRVNYSNGGNFKVKGLMLNTGSEPLPYQPYHHAAISIPLTSPLYSGDKICYVKPGESYVDADGTTVVADRILYGVYRENAVVVFDGSEDEAWGIYPNEQYGGFQIKIEDMKENNYNDGFSNLFPVQKSTINDPGIWLGSTSTSSFSNQMYVHNVNPTYATDVNNWKTWLQSHNMTVVYPIATPYFEPFVDQSIFYNLRTDDTLTYIYSSDPIEPVLTVEVAKNSTGGYLLESYSIIAQLVGRTVVVGK